MLVGLEALHALQHLTSLKSLTVGSIDPEAPPLHSGGRTDEVKTTTVMKLPASLEKLSLRRRMWASPLKPLSLVEALRVIPPSTRVLHFGGCDSILVSLAVSSAADADVQVRCLMRLSWGRSQLGTVSLSDGVVSCGQFTSIFVSSSLGS